MKKIIAAAVGLIVVGAMASSAFAVENKFGGYWRTRAYTMIDFNGDSGTTSLTDTRTRLYYTAIFNESFKFVNKFEYDAVWGGPTSGYGDIGADGKSFEIKNSYAHFKLKDAEFKVGTQGATLARGFLFADDGSGVTAVFHAGEATTLPFLWLKVDEKESDKHNERDYYAVFPIFKITDSLTLNPYILYDKTEGADWNNYYAGIDIDKKTDTFSAWGTAIYEFGEIAGSDVSAYLLAAGAEAGPVHGQMFYATGQDDDEDIVKFVNPPGKSYYWAEIMGLGLFDKSASHGTPGKAISNIWATNIGVKFRPADKFTVGGDVWYAILAEDDSNGEKDLGLEVDLKLTYAILDNLKLDLVGAYLLAGDATGEENPIEIGARLSLAF